MDDPIAEPPTKFLPRNRMGSLLNESLFGTPRRKGFGQLLSSRQSENRTNLRVRPVRRVRWESRHVVLHSPSDANEVFSSLPSSTLQERNKKLVPAISFAAEYRVKRRRGPLSAKKTDDEPAQTVEIPLFES